MINFKLHLYFPWWVGVVIIRNKASQSNLTGTGTEIEIAELAIASYS